MQAVKENKVYTITETEQKSYQDQGFDIYDDDGEIIAHGRGKTVPYEEYEKLLEENKALKTAAEAPEAASESPESAPEEPKKNGKK